jgi:hypothetical protein
LQCWSMKRMGSANGWQRKLDLRFIARCFSKNIGVDDCERRPVRGPYQRGGIRCAGACGPSNN